MSTKLCISDVSSLLKKIKCSSMGHYGFSPPFSTNYFSRCPELDKIVHKVIKQQIRYKATQRYRPTNLYQEGNHRVAVV